MSDPEDPQNTPKTRKTRAGLSLKRINSERLLRRFMNVIDRDSIKYLQLSMHRQLDKDEGDLLIKYVKFLKDMVKQDKEEADNLTVEELQALVDKGPEKDEDE